MNKRIYLILTIILIGSISKINAQNNILYGMKNVPQHNYLNPARQPGCKIYVGIPMAHSLRAKVGFSGLSYNDIFRKHPTAPDSFKIDLDHIHNSLGKRNLVSLEGIIGIIDFGFRFGKGNYITISAKNKTEEYFTFSKSLLDIRHGNLQPLTFDFYEQLVNYNEYSLGYSKTLFNHLTIGARFNLLSGNANIYTKDLKIDWKTQAGEKDMYPWTWNTNVDIRGAAIVGWEVTKDKDGYVDGVELQDNIKDSLNYADLALSKNLGASIDLGVNYSVFHWLTVAASVKDLGFIKWKTNARKIVDKSEFTFTGIDLGKHVKNSDDFKDEKFEDILDDIKDSLRREFDPQVEDGSYTSRLNSKFTASVEIYPIKKVNLSFLYYGMLIKSKLYSAFSVAANANLMKGFSLSVNYSIANNSYYNIGAGLAYKLGPLQMYIATDNIASGLYFIDKKFTEDLMYNTKSINLQLGLNILLCKTKVDKGYLF